MGNTCECSEESLAAERLNELDCSNIFGLGADRAGYLIEPSKEKTVNEYNVDHFTLQSTVAEDEQSLDRWSYFRSARSLEALASHSALANGTTHSPMHGTRGLSRQRE